MQFIAKEDVMKKRIITVIMALALVLGSLGGFSPVRAHAANEDTQDMMTKVLLKVKTKLELPDEYTEFSYNYNNYGERATWNFNWWTQDSVKNIYLNCDDEGHIINMNSYTSENLRKMPDKTADEFKGDAEKLLARVVPEAVGHVILKSTYCMYYNSAYRFYFRRVENGIEMPDNYIYLSVNYEDGSLRGIECNWNYTASIPAAKDLISASEAKDKIGGKLEMNLYYYVTRDADGNEKVFLAYTPSMSYIAVNAKSGKIYTKKEYWNNDAEYTSEEAKEASNDTGASARGYEATLSEAEIKKIAELNDLISSDDAVKMIRNNKYLYLDEKADSVTANLRESDGKYFWYITLRDNRPVDYNNEYRDYYRAYASATMDAKDGKILSFSSSLKSLYYYSQQEIDGIKFNYSVKQCRNVFEEFVKSIEKDRFSQVKLDSTNDAYSEILEKNGEVVNLAYAFNYRRYHDEVPFVSNGISGSVDRISGKVYNYRMNWTDAEIPSARDVIDAKAAFDAYMGYEGFDLVYELVNQYTNTGSIYGTGNEQSIRLVYRTEIYPAYVDAFTGKQLNYNGEEYVNTRTDYVYTDIEGSKFEKEIKILASMGIGLPGEKFKPDKKITKEELASMIMQMPMFGYRADQEEYKSDKGVNRQEAAKIILDVMGLGSLAKLDIYKLTYSDAKKVSKGYAGYVAFAGAFDLFGNGKAKKFGPKTALTRGEAARMILNSANAYVSLQY